MKKYIILLHKWWMDSRGWEEHEVEAENRKAAKLIAKGMCFDRTNTFQHCGFYVI